MGNLASIIEKDNGRAAAPGPDAEWCGGLFRAPCFAGDHITRGCGGACRLNMSAASLFDDAFITAKSLVRTACDAVVTAAARRMGRARANDHIFCAHGRALPPRGRVCAALVEGPLCVPGGRAAAR